MVKKYLTIVILVIVVFSLAACSSKTTGTPAGMPGGIPPAQAGTAASTVIPTDTATVEPSATATMVSTKVPTLTATAEPVVLTVIFSIMCQKGPGDNYAGAAYLSKDDQLIAVGRNAANDYYFVEIPNETGKYCWLWANYALVSGESSTLPILANDGSTVTPTTVAATVTPTAVITSTPLAATATK